MKLLWILVLLFGICSGDILAQEIDQRELEQVVTDAEQGDVAAQAKLGFIFYYGKGVTKDIVRALKWYHAAAEQGHAKTQITLGTMYRYGGNGLTKSRAEASRWYRKAVDQGNASGAYSMAAMLDYEAVTYQDRIEAVKWYHKSAELGNRTAQYRLGHLYLRGELVKEDLQEAKKWFSKAAAQGSQPAKERLYEMTDEGKKDFAFNETVQTMNSILFLLLLFPVWWLIVGYFLNCSASRQGIVIAIVIAGGVVGFFVAFICSGGAGGSSEMSASDWGCFLPYTAIHNTGLAAIIFSGRRKSNYSDPP